MVYSALGAAGVRCVWAGAGLQRAAYRGGGILRGFPPSLFVKLILFVRHIRTIIWHCTTTAKVLLWSENL